ncbi:hypothetical protein CYMTET_45334, partial [Cymbomonas tetramitiformis]
MRRVSLPFSSQKSQSSNSSSDDSRRRKLDAVPPHFPLPEEPRPEDPKVRWESFYDNPKAFRLQEMVNIQKAGFLIKQGESSIVSMQTKPWDTRWCVVDGALLFYFKSKDLNAYPQ